MPHAPGHWGYTGPGPSSVPSTKNISNGVGTSTNVNPYISFEDYRPETGMYGSRFSESPYGGSSFSGGMGLGGLDPYAAGMLGLRGPGGTGGGSVPSEGNMDANELIALSEFLGENVTSFAGGGKMHNPYAYEGGGQINNLVNELAAINQISNLNRANQGMKMRKRYTQGGRF